MAVSKVAIANIALIKIGAKRISSFNDDSAEARAVSAVYDLVRDEVLGEHPWSFAQKRAALTKLDITPVMTDDYMTIVYAKPADLIKINFISDPTATFKTESDGILSDTEDLKIIYTYRNDDPTTYFSKFNTALAMRLAYEICFDLSNSVQKAEGILTEYEKIRLPRAISGDSQQNTPLQPIQNEWQEARETAGNAFVVQPGQATWHPVW